MLMTSIFNNSQRLRMPADELVNLTETRMPWVGDATRNMNAPVVIFRLSARVLVPASLENAPKRGARGQNRERGFNIAYEVPDPIVVSVSSNRNLIQTRRISGFDCGYFQTFSVLSIAPGVQQANFFVFESDTVKTWSSLFGCGRL
jgi:hypothetical protein